MLAQTSGAISVGPLLNRQGGHLFFSLNTGCIVSHRSLTVLPMPQSVINHVHDMARDQPKMLTLTDKHGMEIGDDKDVITPPDIPVEIPGVVRDTAQIPGVDTAEIGVEGDAEIGVKGDEEPTKLDQGTMPEPTDPPIIDNDVGIMPEQPTVEFEPNTDKAKLPTPSLPAMTPKAKITPN